MNNAIDSAVTSSLTQQSAADVLAFLAMLDAKPPRPVLTVIEGGLTDEPPPEDGAGDKYDPTLSRKEIAARIRADIKAAIASGELPAIKTSVRKDHHSIEITVTDVCGKFELINPAFVEAEKAKWHHNIPRLSPEASRVLDVLNGFHSAYNYDRSDPMTDYYNVNYYGRAAYDWRLLSDAEDRAMK